MPINTLPVYTGTWPNANTQTDSDYANNTFFAYEWIGTTLLPALNIFIPDFDTLTTQAGLDAATATAAAALAKEHATGNLMATGGSAKAWAVDTASPDGTTSKSAKTLAVEALSSATAALNAKLAAEAALDSFDDRYLGSKTADPTLDNDGNPLTMGAMYYHTNIDPTLNKLKVYDSDLAVWTNMIFVPTSHTGLSGIGTKSHNQLESELAIKTNKSTSFFYGGF